MQSWFWCFQLIIPFFSSHRCLSWKSSRVLTAPSESELKLSLENCGPQCLLCPPHWSVSGVVLDQRSLDRAEQLSQWFSSPLYYYSSDWRESVSSWGPASFMTTCSPFRQRYFHGILSGPTAHVYWCIWLHIDFEHLYFIVKRRLAMLRYEFLGLPFTLSVWCFSLFDADIIRQMLSYFLVHLSC